MAERLTPLQRSILHSLRGGRSLTAAQVYERMELLRPDVVDATIASAVQTAVARGLERLADEGYLVRRPEPGADRYGLLSVRAVGQRLQAAEAA